MISLCLKSLEAISKENTSAKLAYLAETFIETLLVIKPAIWALQNSWLFEIELVSKAELVIEVMWITKILCFKSSVVVADSFFSTDLTYLLVAKTFLIM